MASKDGEEKDDDDLDKQQQGSKQEDTNNTQQDDDMAQLIPVPSRGHDTSSPQDSDASLKFAAEEQAKESQQEKGDDFGFEPEAPHPTRPPPPPQLVNVQPYMDPQVIFRNVMIMEVSLHDKYAELRARRRKNALFLLVLIIWTVVFAAKQFIWRLESFAYRQVCLVGLLFGMAALGLFYLSGVYHNTLVYPRRFVSTSNKGLRQFNIKLTFASRYARWWWWPPKFKTFIRGCESIDDVVGGSIVKIVFLPRAFSNEFREAWDYYRDEFWTAENDRRRNKRRRDVLNTTTTTTTSSSSSSSSRAKKTGRQHHNQSSSRDKQSRSVKKKPPL